jgi:hypothetical protein
MLAFVIAAAALRAQRPARRTAVPVL